MATDKTGAAVKLITMSMAIATGLVLVVIPEPASTATGLLILGTTLGVAANDRKQGRKR